MTVFSPDGLLTVREVAETMRVSTMTVYRLIKAHELSATRVGKHFRIRHADLVAYLDARRVGPPPARGSSGELSTEAITPGGGSRSRAAGAGAKAHHRAPGRRDRAQLDRGGDQWPAV